MSGTAGSITCAYQRWSRAAATTATWSCCCCEGLISAEQAHNHPMRNFVECCLGGDPILPEMSLTRRQPIEPQDVLLVCTDGLWGALRTTRRSSPRSARPVRCARSSSSSATRAVKRAGGGSDNTSAAALRWLGD